MSAILKKTAGDIRFWIVLFFFVRLYGIWFPPLDISHNWRQTTVTMVARNFYETDNNILYPRLDIAGEKTGITGMEFPLLNYGSYLISLVFGYDHWYGRLIVLLVSSLGIWYFFRLCSKLTDERTGFNASVVLLFSIWYTYSRKIMPDTFSMSFILMALWYAWNYLEKGRYRDLLLYTVLCAAGMLSKLPSAFILTLLIIPWFRSSAGKRLGFMLASSIPAAFSFWWYFIHVPYLNQTYGFMHFFMGKSMTEGGSEIMGHLDETLSKFYDVAIKYIGFACFLFGLWKAMIKKEKKLIYVFFLSFLSFLPVMLKGGFTFYHHSYYIIPFVPVMALVSGYGISCLGKRIYMQIALLAIGTEGFFNHLDDFRIRSEYRPLMKLESLMDSLECGKELIAVNSGAFPTPVYFAHRRGWVAFGSELGNPAFTDSLRLRGLRYVVIMKRVFGEDTILPYREIYNDPDFRIYRLKEQGEP